MDNGNQATEVEMQEIQNQNMLKKFPKESNKSKLVVALGAFLVVLAGVGTGWFFSGKALGKSEGMKTASEMAPDVEVSETEAGISDTSEFPDEAEGTLKEGGTDGEGTHHLERPGGESKYVYLTSTVIDLQMFVDKKVKVWGETVSGKKAGWLMDVGKVKVIE